MHTVACALEFINAESTIGKTCWKRSDNAINYILCIAPEEQVSVLHGTILALSRYKLLNLMERWQTAHSQIGI